MNKYDYNKLTPFKWFILENFPLIDEDFDALTNWQLFCKLGKEINKIINSQNNVGTQMENVTNAFIALQNYVDNYFENLDVQDEINNKLDEMADSGELTELISHYLELNALLCFNTKNDMKNAENLIDGSFVKTLGTTTYNDGYGNFYKIREIINTDVVDDDNIVALTNFNNLIAEKMPNTYLTNAITNVTNELNENIIKNNILKNKRFVMIGDSYVTGSLNGEQYATDGWAKRIKDKLGLSNSDCFIYGDGGAGFTQNGHNGYNFVTLLSNNLTNITNKNTIDYIIICGGFNDRTSTIAQIETKISEVSTIVKNNFPNAKLYIGCISNSNQLGDGATVRRDINHISIPAYKNCIKYDAYYLNGVENILKDYSLMGTDYFHPSIDGYNALRDGIIQSLETGNFVLSTPLQNITITAVGNPISENYLGGYTKIVENKLMIVLIGNILFTNDVDFTSASDQALLTLGSDYIRQSFGTDLQLNGFVTIGSAEKPCHAYMYINNLNRLCVRFLDHPEGVTTGKRLYFRIQNFFGITD